MRIRYGWRRRGNDHTEGSLSVKLPLREYKGVLALVIANFIWSGTFPVTALALRQVTPIFLSLVRLAAGALLLTPLLFYRRTSWDLLVWRWQPVLWALLLGILGFTIPMYLEIQGLALSNPALAAIFIALEPVFTVLMSALWLRESLPKMRWLAVGMAVVGAWATAGFPRPGNTGHWTGDVLLLGAVLCYAAYNVTSKYLLYWVTPEAAAAGTLWGGLVGTLPMWWWMGHWLPQTLSTLSWGTLAYLSVLGTAGAYLLWMFAVARVPMSLAALFLYVQPVLGVILSEWVVPAPLKVSYYVGASLILAALYLGRQRSLLMPSDSESRTSAVGHSDSPGA